MGVKIPITHLPMGTDWGPTVTATGPRQYSSLRFFLRASGVNPGAQPLRKLAQKQSSVRKFMKL